MNHTLEFPEIPLPQRMWWYWDDPVESVGFFRIFSLKQSVSAVLLVSCSGTYQSWMDGQPLPVPDQPYPSWRVMHHIPVQLTPGNHCLSIQAKTDEQKQPSILVCLDWEIDGHLKRIGGDSTWMMIANPSTGWQASPQSSSHHSAWAFDGVWAEPWGMPCNAPDDFCRFSTGWQQVKQETVSKIVTLYQGTPSLGSAAWLRENGKVEMRPPLPHAFVPPTIPLKREGLEWYRVREAHSKNNNIWMQLFETSTPHIIYDTGGETFARLKIQVLKGGPAVIAVSTGESLAEVKNYIRKVTDIIKLADGETFATTPTGFRYVKITVLSSGSETTVIAPPVIQHITYPVQASGSFHCSDPTLNKIWDISAHTVHLCMQNEIWDGVKRDQLPWMGDLYTENLVVYHAFGDYRLARRSIEVLADLSPVQSSPLSQQRYPGLEAVWKIPDGDINNIPSYTLWWLVGLADYFAYTNDLSLVKSLESQLSAVIDHIASWVDDQGVWHFRGGWDYIDWSPVPASERETYCHLLACIGIRLGSQMLAAIGKSNIKYLELLKKMQSAVRSTWMKNGIFNFGNSHHTNSMAIRSGALTLDESKAVFSQTLTCDPPIRMTYWHRYLDLTAAETVGDIQWGLDYIRKHWGQILQLDVTTLWEAFDASWVGDDPHAVSMVAAEYARYGGYETSLCHGWSGGPVVWLHRAILGISPAQPGFSTVAFCPNLGDLEWAEGTIPTPHGIISVRLEKRPGQLPLASITLPEGIDIETDSNLQQKWEIQRSPVFG